MNTNFFALYSARTAQETFLPDLAIPSQYTQRRRVLPTVGAVPWAQQHSGRPGVARADIACIPSLRRSTSRR